MQRKERSEASSDLTYFPLESKTQCQLAELNLIQPASSALNAPHLVT